MGWVLCFGLTRFALVWFFSGRQVTYWSTWTKSSTKLTQGPFRCSTLRASAPQGPPNLCRLGTDFPRTTKIWMRSEYFKLRFSTSPHPQPHLWPLVRVAKDTLEPLILLPQPPVACWEYRHRPSHQNGMMRYSLGHARQAGYPLQSQTFKSQCVTLISSLADRLNSRCLPRGLVNELFPEESPFKKPSRDLDDVSPPPPSWPDKEKGKESLVSFSSPFIEGLGFCFISELK